MLESYVPLLIFVLIVLGLIGALVTLSFVLGPNKPHKSKLATYESGDQFDHDAARGFIRLWGLSQQTQARQQLLKGGKGFDLPGLTGPERQDR